MSVIQNKNKQSAGNFYLKNSGTDRVFSIVPYLDVKGGVTFFENQLNTQFGFNKNLNPIVPERYEGDIKSFSVKSRRRLFDLFTRLQYSEYGTPLFVSATYHYDAPNTRAEIKSFLERYIKRIKRDLPPFHSIWKFEYQKRGEPHFHFMLLPLDKKEDFFSDNNDKIITKHWLDMKPCKCDDCKTYSIKTVKIKEFSHAMIYISKEIGKVLENYVDHDLGRIWGNTRDIKVNSIREAKCTYAEFRELLQTISDNCKLNESTQLYLQALKEMAVDSSLWIPLSEIKFFIDEWQRKLKAPATASTGRLKLKRFNFSG